MTTIYCLELENGRFYVGQTPTGRLKRRYEEHKYFGGAKWTSRHGVRRLLWAIEVLPSEADEAEDSACLEIMLKHGRNSCRGGKFNIGYDVPSRGPRWLKAPYAGKWQEILAAGQHLP
jgi:predicted GIY-YIG superfamily endonuclease